MVKVVRFISLFISVIICILMCIIVYFYYNIPNVSSAFYGTDPDFKFWGITVLNGLNDIPTSGVNASHHYKEYDIYLFGIIPVKHVRVKYVNKIMVRPCGTLFGVQMLTDGVVLVNTQDVQLEDETKKTANPAKDAGLQAGDVLIYLNGEKVNSNGRVKEITSSSNGNEITVRYVRNEDEYETKIKPVWSKNENRWIYGLWIRDSSAGIGTMTFCTDDGGFGGLGHSICDVDTKNTLPLGSGEIISVSIGDICKSEKGKPGELYGKFDAGEPIGKIKINSDYGLYGKTQKISTNHEVMPIGLKQEARTGKAVIYSTISNGIPEEYEINIESINLNHEFKNFVIEITDPKLLEKTGGIVQGMSGSPIIQDGKVIGAVTHVFLNEPKKGYGVFSEAMVEFLERID